jgi:flagellar biosynthesis protein FlhF
MNVKRFTARTSRDALSLVRQALGDDAVVLSTKPSATGVEVLAMAPESLRQVERLNSAGGAEASAAPAKAAAKPVTPAARIEPALEQSSAGEDADRLAMSTLSFQDYVRERMLRRRQAALGAESRMEAGREPLPGSSSVSAADSLSPSRTPSPQAQSPSLEGFDAAPRGEGYADHSPAGEAPPARRAAPSAAPARPLHPAMRDAPLLHDALAPASEIHVPGIADAAGSARRDQDDMMKELRSMKGLIEERFGALAFMEKLQRQPAQARLTQKLLDCGFSPALIRKLADGLAVDVPDESAWAAAVLERNLQTSEADAPLEEIGGVYALVGATGVGKTTTTAKIAAAFATRYGAANLGLVTLDAYRVGAHEQLRAYGRILGVPVHTAHDRASLEDLLDLLTAKKMVLIDTAGMAQRDARTRELLDMLSHRSVQKLLVVNAASQGETIEDVIVAYRAASCAGIVLSKMDEAVKLGPALDALIRHRLKVVGVANGQRVPEDWHRLSANALVQRALRGGGGAAYRLDADDVKLVFTAPHAGYPSQRAARA